MRCPLRSRHDDARPAARVARGWKQWQAAESLGLEKEIGRIAVGYAADVVATDGDPVAQIEASQHVSFVMKGGRVYRNDGARVAGVRQSGAAK